MKSVLFICMGLMVASCASRPSLPSGQRASEAEASWENFLQADNNETLVTANPEVRPGFLIQLTSGVDPKITGSYRVATDGSLKLPYNVNIQASGLTLKALSEKIVGQYQSFYKKNAQIQVRLTERKYYIEVRGLVQKPGVVLVSEREKIEEIIKKSGDLTLANEARVVQIQRGENTYVIGLEEYFQGLGINRSPRWFGGEKVFFLKSSAAYNEDESTGIQFLGDVKNPGALAYVDKADFYHYLIKSGGTTPSSDLDRIQVVRMTKKGRAVTKGSAKDIAEHITLEPGDTIIVGSGMSGQYERNIQLGSLITTIISTLAILVIAF